MTTALSPDINREEWLAARRKGIGASEIAAVLGISPWESPFSLYWRKVQGWDFEPNEVMRTGAFLEPTIAGWFVTQHRERIESWGQVGLRAHNDRPWQLATPDYVIEWQMELCECRTSESLLECKWVAGSWDGWGEPGTDDVPVYYRAQVLWQCDVMGLDKWHIAALGPGGFREYSGCQSTRDLVVMHEAGRRFMARIESGDPPPIDDHHATLSTLKRLHPDLDDVEAEVDERTAAGYLRACRAFKLAEQVKDRYEARLRAEMGRAKRATVDGRKVATRTVTDVAGSTVIRNPYRRDYLTPAKEKK